MHYSTDYVFDGTSPIHVEDEPLSPLGVYGQSKAAGELAVATTPRHYLLRTSWLVGHGSNVVDDQIGRLTFADELARATQHLVTVGAPFGTYHVSNGGPSGSWADVARAVFGLRGRDPDDVTPVSTKEYVAGNPAAARPAHSTFDLTKLESTGYEPADWRMALEEYVVQLPNATG